MNNEGVLTGVTISTYLPYKYLISNIQIGTAKEKFQYRINSWRIHEYFFSFIHMVVIPKTRFAAIVALTNNSNERNLITAGSWQRDANTAGRRTFIDIKDSIGR